MIDLATQEERLRVLRAQKKEEYETRGQTSIRRAGTPRGDLAERASVHANADVKNAVVEALAMVLDRVERALEKLREGTYGRCDLCGHPIPDARLKLCPEATEHVQHSWPRGQKPEGLGEEVMACSDYGAPLIKKPWFVLRR